MTVVGRGPKGCGAARGHEGRPQLVPAGAGAVNRSRTLPKARVTARVRLHERVSRRNQPTSRVGICLMSRSFGTLVQLNTLLKVCSKLGVTRDGRMSDLWSDQGAKKKASEYRLHCPAPGGVPDCSQSCSQLVTRMLPSLQLLATDISDHPQAPLGRRVAGEDAEGFGSRANFALQLQKLSQNH